MPDIRRDLRKFLPHLLKAREDGLNEADTVQRIVLFLSGVLGYDQLTEISREAQIKDKYVDLVVKMDGVVRLLVEAKAAGVTLRDRHLEQAERYAAEGNHQWTVLTNGVEWKLYHLTFDEGIEYDKVFEVDLAGEDLDRACECLELLHRSSLLRGKLDAHWEHHRALSAEAIGRILFTEDVLRLIRRMIRKGRGPLVDIEDLAEGLKGLLSQDARDSMGPIKIRRRRRADERKGAEAAPPKPPAPPAASAQPGEPAAPAAGV